MHNMRRIWNFFEWFTRHVLVGYPDFNRQGRSKDFVGFKIFDFGILNFSKYFLG